MFSSNLDISNSYPKGFTFEIGEYCLSVQFGGVNFCNNRHKSAFDMINDTGITSCEDCEILVTRIDGEDLSTKELKAFKLNSFGIIGYVTKDKFQELLIKLMPGVLFKSVSIDINLYYGTKKDGDLKWMMLSFITQAVF